MTLFGRERRGTPRAPAAGAAVTFRVRDGRDPARISAAVDGTVLNLTRGGMAVLSPRIAPSGLHVMYDTLMVVHNTVEAEVFLPGAPPLAVKGKVTWFRASDDAPGFYLFGMAFSSPIPEQPGVGDVPLAGSNSPH
jgi:hypothetical protein